MMLCICAVFCANVTLIKCIASVAFLKPLSCPKTVGLNAIHMFACSRYVPPSVDQKYCVGSKIDSHVVTFKSNLERFDSKTVSKIVCTVTHMAQQNSQHTPQKGAASQVIVNQLHDV